MKKKYMIAILIGILLLIGFVIVLALGRDKGKTEKDNTENDVIVHETDEDTVEKKAEDGLKESDSEDGPVLSEDNMIDFNGSGDQPDDGNKHAGNQEDGNNANGNPSEGAENSGAGDETGEEPSEDEENSKDTGAWGVFY